MDLTPLVEAAQNSALSEWMRTSLKAVAIINAFHVISIVTVFGTIFLVDLRLLGYPNVQRSFKRMHDELLRLDVGRVRHRRRHRRAAVHGQRRHLPPQHGVLAQDGHDGPRGHQHAGVRARHREVRGELGQRRGPPKAARLAGALSIVLWVAVIVFGRWIGFTKGYDFAIPEDVQFDFSLPTQ